MPRLLWQTDLGCEFFEFPHTWLNFFTNEGLFHNRERP